MDRRHLIISGGALALALPTSGRAAQATTLREAAREAWLYGLPLIEFARVRGDGALDGRASRINRIIVNPNLVGPEARRVTTPNNDTLYASAMIDLAGGPAVLTLPAAGDRYVSVQLMDPYTNTFTVLGTRTTGPDGGRFTLVGPQFPAPAGSIRSPTPWAWLLARILVDGAEDLTAARAVQAGLKLEAPKGRAPRRFAERQAPWRDYFSSVQALLVENPPPATDTAFFRRVKALGLGAPGGFDPNRFSAAEAAEIEAGAAEARSLLGGRRGVRNEGGWVYPLANLGDYGQDYLSRAGVALAGLGALPRQEAMYMRALAPDGTPIFDGGQAWRLSFPAGGLPPVSAFWSLSMYEVTPEGQLFFTRNPLGRYAIGDRTRGLRRGADGSLDIWISRTDPGEARRANWLPAPAAGPFGMHFRAYLPRPELLSGAYRLPALAPA